MTNKIIKEFQEYLLNDGKATGTIDSYMTEIRLFFEYLTNEKTSFEGKINRMMFLSYKDFLLKVNAKPATVNKKVNSINVFNSFLIEKGYMNDKVIHPNRDKIRIAYGSEKQVSVLSDYEIDTLLNHLDSNNVYLRDKLIVYLLLYTGVRVSELTNIKLCNIDFNSNFLTIDFGKGGVTREIPLNSKLVTLLEEYLTTERLKSKFYDSEYLLLSQRSHKMHRDAVNRVIKKIGKELNMYLHCHLFRHTIFTKLVRKGVPLSTVSMLCGHRSVQTTITYYVQTSREDKRKAIDLL